MKVIVIDNKIYTIAEGTAFILSMSELDNYYALKMLTPRLDEFPLYYIHEKLGADLIANLRSFLTSRTIDYMDLPKLCDVIAAKRMKDRPSDKDEKELPPYLEL